MAKRQRLQVTYAMAKARVCRWPMAEFQIKSKQLLKLLPELQCRECKDVPGPEGTKKNRYYCMDESHALCEKHKTRCPCGSLVGKKPSPTIAKLLQDLPWMCQNYENGCREIKMDGEELEHHQGECIFRKVFCPDWCCKEKKVIFKDVNDHLTTVHKNDFEMKSVYSRTLEYGKANEMWYNFEKIKIILPVLGVRKNTSTDGDIFYEAGYFANNAFHYVIYFFGSPDEAKKFSLCTISITKRDGEKFTYTGKIHTLDEKKEDIMASESCLKIGIDAFKRSLDEKKNLCIEYSIRNLKKRSQR